MFIVLNVEGGTCYFEMPEIDKYTHVALVSIEPSEAIKFVLGDFVDLSLIAKNYIGIVGVRTANNTPFYAPLKARRRTHFIKLVDKDLKQISPSGIHQVVLYFADK